MIFHAEAGAGVGHSRRGKVGFFWIVPDRQFRETLLGETIELEQAERYGAALTHATGHYEFWEAMKRRGPAWLRRRQISGSILSTDYEQWPRGRVVFQGEKARFDLFAHSSILRSKPRLALVFEMFELDQNTTRLRRDGHYAMNDASTCVGLALSALRSNRSRA